MVSGYQNILFIEKANITKYLWNEFLWGRRNSITRFNIQVLIPRDPRP
jgi:hypothetical protein